MCTYQKYTHLSFIFTQQGLKLAERLINKTVLTKNKN
jgi:hypothetical protein